MQDLRLLTQPHRKIPWTQTFLVVEISTATFLLYIGLDSTGFINTNAKEALPKYLDSTHFSWSKIIQEDVRHLLIVGLVARILPGREVCKKTNITSRIFFKIILSLGRYRDSVCSTSTPRIILAPHRMHQPRTFWWPGLAMGADVAGPGRERLWSKGCG